MKTKQSPNCQTWVEKRCHPRIRCKQIFTKRGGLCVGKLGYPLTTNSTGALASAKPHTHTKPINRIPNPEVLRLHLPTSKPFYVTHKLDLPGSNPQSKKFLFSNDACLTPRYEVNWCDDIFGTHTNTLMVTYIGVATTTNHQQTRSMNWWNLTLVTVVDVKGTNIRQLDQKSQSLLVLQWSELHYRLTNLEDGQVVLWDGMRDDLGFMCVVLVWINHYNFVTGCVDCGDIELAIACWLLLWLFDQEEWVLFVVSYLNQFIMLLSTRLRISKHNDTN